MKVDSSLLSLAPSSQLQNSPSAPAAKDLAKAQGALAGARDGSMDADEVGKQFEELFSTMLVREMRKSVGSLNPEGGMFGKGAGSDIYEGWFDEHLGASLAARNTLGLAGMIKAGVAHLQQEQEQEQS